MHTNLTFTDKIILVGNLTPKCHLFSFNTQTMTMQVCLAHQAESPLEMCCKHHSSIRVGCWDWHIQYMGLCIKDAAICKPVISWWRHQMETSSALLALRAGNSPVPGEFPAQRPGTRSFDVFFDLRPNKRLSKQSWGNNFNDNLLKVSDHDRINLISFYGLWLMTSHHWLRKSLGAENFSLMWCNKQLWLLVFPIGYSSNNQNSPQLYCIIHKHMYYLQTYICWLLNDNMIFTQHQFHMCVGTQSSKVLYYVHYQEPIRPIGFWHGLLIEIHIQTFKTFCGKSRF